MKITIYTENLKQALLDEDEVTADSVDTINDRFNAYIYHIESFLEEAGHIVDVEEDDNQPHLYTYQATQDDGQPVEIELPVYFWDWV